MMEVNQRTVGLWVALFLGLVCARSFGADTFRRGDANVDSTVNAADAMSILQSLFVTPGPPDCLDALDANDDGEIDVSDSIYVLSFLFRGGAAPGWPFPDCGLDPTPDDLDCATYSECVECEPLADAAAAIGDSIPRVTCVPEDAASFEFDVFPLGALVVTVCPASEATPCGGGDEPGCAVEIRSVGVEIDLSPPRRIRFEVTGLRKCRSMSSVMSTSAITPSFRGRTASIPSGVRPSIRLASRPTPRILRVPFSTATTEGSLRTIPSPFT